MRLDAPLVAALERPVAGICALACDGMEREQWSGNSDAEKKILKALRKGKRCDIPSGLNECTQIIVGFKEGNQSDKVTWANYIR